MVAITNDVGDILYTTDIANALHDLTGRPLPPNTVKRNPGDAYIDPSGYEMKPVSVAALRKMAMVKGYIM